MKESVYRIIKWTVFGSAAWLIALGVAQKVFADSERQLFCSKVAVVSADLATLEYEYRLAYLYEIQKRNYVLSMHVIPATEAAANAYEEGMTKEQVLDAIYNQCLAKIQEV